MSQMPMQPPPPPDSWEIRRKQEMQKREQQKLAEKHRASRERMEESRRSNKMFHIEHGPDHETAGEMYRRIKAESKRPKSHAFRKGIMKGFGAAMMAQKAARDDINKQLNDAQMDDSHMDMSASGFMVDVPEGTPHEDVVKAYESIAAKRQFDAELEDFRKQVTLGENQTLVRTYDMQGKSTGFGVVDDSPEASFDNIPDLPTLPNGQKPTYMRSVRNMPEQQAKTGQSKQKSADLSPAGRKLPDISHIKEPSREAEHVFEMAGSR